MRFGFFEIGAQLVHNWFYPIIAIFQSISGITSWPNLTGKI
jgi:hypothetical protein